MEQVATEFWDQIQNPVVYALPVFVISMAIEAAALRSEARPTAGYVRPEARSSIMMGLGSLAFMFVFKLATLVAFSVLYVQLAPWQLPTTSWWTWLVLIIAVDLTWYCNHRFSHRVRIGWAGHRAHHSSESFNFSSAVRLKWNPWSEAIFWMPLPLLGFAPWTIYVAYGFNMIYQFFLHTELVGKLPRPFEFLFNTPAHHRIHHSRRPEHLDKNYGGILIIWDRTFGTIVDGDCHPEYGLFEAKPFGEGIMQIQYGEYARIVADVRRTKSWRERLAYVFAPPGWRPRGAVMTPRKPLASTRDFASGAMRRDDGD
ncbi:sterol desaturase family protein [Mycobacterium sp. AT1]|uniref:sterol desaturase family protein n=1 Tax=Mycobacterium sp. AT1 TaxID=1961706 RepID=UPI0009AC1D8B|nr:sterol desaturase family protein [Mycobacterium sp. AT1]OPX08938.1 C-5 sterol desaturase [Mycobacterium sp. AT1]